MSAFAVCFNRTEDRADSVAIEAMTTRLSDLGADGARIDIVHAVGMGFQHFWTVPEEWGEYQPLKHSGAHLHLMWDGRLDNRAELYGRLHDQPQPLKTLSDAALFLDLFAQQGLDCFAHIIGPFAVVIYDEQNRRLTVARDAVGGRYISYFLSEKLFVAATQDYAFEAHGEIPIEVDSARLAIALGAKELLDNASTFIKNVKQLRPGTVMQIDADRVQTQQFWFPNPRARQAYRSSDELAEQFRSIFTDSVHCRMRASKPLAVMMSGGLDSAPIASIAADRLKNSNSVQRLKAVSWVFDRYSECDERAYMQGLYDRFPIEPVHVNCDDAWPFKNENRWPVHPSSPEQTPYREFHQRAYSACHGAGARVMLSGMSGDSLYLGGESVIYELLKTGRWSAAFRECHYRRREFKNFTQFIKAYFVRPTHAYRLYRQFKPLALKNGWLTDSARDSIPGPEGWLEQRRFALRPHQYLRLLEITHGYGNTLERYYSALHHVQLRYPFRDRRLIEFMLQVPSAELEFAGFSRPIIRRALHDLLPSEILKRREKTSFQPIFNEGIETKRQDFVQSLLNAPDRRWPGFIQKCYIRYPYEQLDSEKLLYLWVCASFEYWRMNTSLGSKI